MKIKNYQRDCFKNYKQDIGYPSEYSYLKGTPINVLVPIETTLNNIMIIGAYPSAKFYTINGVPDTPMANNDYPFSNEKYFDGSRVRTIPSGKELNDIILDKIGVDRSECWVTNLVKVFLFKKGHIERYEKLGKTDLSENRTKFFEYAEKSMQWLDKEIEICNPKVIILLGFEVTKVFFDLTDKKAKEYLNGYIKTKIINGVKRNIICLPHPGILMRKTKKNPWPDKFDKHISKIVKNKIKKLKKSK
jgi:uracil-DNA glycosylase|tara:strand:- start:178 stop:918 length:741 start_codon:yes stop_codon:yes gene_type:complete